MVIDGPPPPSGKFVERIEGLKQMLGEPVTAHGSVVALDASMLLQLAVMDEIDANAALCSHSRGTALTYFGPLSQQTASGFARHSIDDLAVGKAGRSHVELFMSQAENSISDHILFCRGLPSPIVKLYAVHKGRQR